MAFIVFNLFSEIHSIGKSKESVNIKKNGKDKIQNPGTRELDSEWDSKLINVSFKVVI